MAEWCEKCGSQKCSDDTDSRVCDDCLNDWADENEIYL